MSSIRPVPLRPACGSPNRACPAIAVADSSAAVDGAAARAAIREQALALGFDAVGFAPPDAGARAARALARQAAEGAFGDMDWMLRTAARRADPRVLWPEVRSVIVLGLNYGPAEDPLAVTAKPEAGAISVYARNRDYHDPFKKRLKALARWIHGRFAAEVKVFVDTAPVMEKPLAEKAGLGWQGKHSNLVSRSFGSWLFLGEVFTTLALAPDAPMADHCGSCRNCLDVCPTDAFPAPYRLDPRRCLSYLTIEHKGHIAREFRVAMGNRVYGCDDCLAVCPWNKFAARTEEVAFQPRAELSAPRLAELARLDDAGFRAFFRASPIKRVGRDRFLRNVLIALGNSGDSGQAETVARHLDDPAPVVRAMAVWALSRLVGHGEFAALRARHAAADPDPAVRREWAAAS